MVHLQQNHQDMASYLGEVDTLKDEFNSLMPFTNDVDVQEGQRDNFFMVLALIGLRSDLCSLKDQILTGSVIPTLEDVSARLLRISLSKSDATDMESSVLAVQGNQGQGGNRKGKGKKFHCTYCDKKGHTRDACWALHGRPPRSNQSDNTGKPIAHLAQSNEEGLLPQPTNKSQDLDSITLIGEDYKEYLQFQAAKQHPPSTSIAHSGNSVACLTKSSPVGPWILDSGASDHISSNHNLFSTLISPSTPSKVTLANGSQTQVKGIGDVQLLPSISLTTVLFTPECPYNLISISKLTKNLNCSVTFTADSVVMQDRSTGRMIGTRYES
ncbi:hypothetical protein MANES_13G009802v8 [Manihot esculenta]|uniref:Uncharacterized protein n=1 Tax=Manihot esculenta TaxID=3983 RepID=A0ACB7GJ86_MANES|nr:hypothetical protein MANES_13G009802v8 [Manihot esculenta]